MDYETILKVNQSEDKNNHDYYYTRVERITGYPFIDIFLQKIVHGNYKVHWFNKEIRNTFNTTRLSICSFNHEPAYYIKNERYKFNIRNDREGNIILWYYHEELNTLFLHEPEQTIRTKSIFDWQFKPYLYIIKEKLESDNGFLKFKGVYFGRKVILTVMQKSELRHMYE